MAIINYNLKQITNHTVEQFVYMIETIEEKEYYNFTFGKNIEGVNNPTDSMPILKFGYICEPNALDIPIYITFNKESFPKEIRLGKTGMFEIQPEIFIDKNAENQEIDIDFYITSVKVPKGYSFSLDYITAAATSDTKTTSVE